MQALCVCYVTVPYELLHRLGGGRRETVGPKWPLGGNSGEEMRIDYKHPSNILIDGHSMALHPEKYGTAR